MKIYTLLHHISFNIQSFLKALYSTQLNNAFIIFVTSKVFKNLFTKINFARHQYFIKVSIFYANWIFLVLRELFPYPFSFCSSLQTYFCIIFFHIFCLFFVDICKNFALALSCLCYFYMFFICLTIICIIKISCVFL